MENCIPHYPDLTKNDAQIVLNAFAEYRELKAQPGTEPRVVAGSYFRAQELVSRLLKVLDRLFIIHEPGTGKSCTITAIVELIKEVTNLFDKTFIITYSSLTNEMKKQIICKCTNNKYINDKGKINTRASAMAVRQSNKKPFTENYTLESYDKFHKRILGKSYKQLIEEFAYSFICVDEATKLIILDFSPSTTFLNKPNGAITAIETEISPKILYLKNIKKIEQLDDPNIINLDIPYIQYWRLFHAVGNLSKCVIATGTPGTNRPSEILMLSNLLLPLDNQIDVELFAQNVFYYNLKKYARYYNNLFTFIKSSNVVAKVNYIGKPIKYNYKVEFPADDVSDDPEIILKEFDSQYTLYKVELYGHQAEKLFVLREDGTNNKIDNAIDQVLCYTNFEGVYGKNANLDTRTLPFLSQPGIEGLNTRMNSCGIYAEIVRIEVDEYQKAKAKGKPGPHLCFNYIPFVKSVLGSLKQCFIAAGFEVLEDFSMFKKAVGDYCDMGSVNFKGLIKRPRAVFLTGDVDVDVRDMILDVASSPDNVYGEYIQFLDGSEVMGIGINTKNAIREMKPLNEWNEAKDKQSDDRVFRENAHDYIREEMANDIEKQTGVKPNPYDLDVYVNVYKMAGYSRYFYMKKSKAKEIPPEWCKPETTPFRLERGRLTIRSIENQDIVLLNNNNVMHIVGFCESGKGKNLMYKQVMSYAIDGEVPHLKIAEKEKIDVYTDLTNLTLKHMDIIVSMSGILYIFNITDEVLSQLKNKVFVYHTNCEFKNLYKNGYYHDECYLISLNRKHKDLSASSEVTDLSKITDSLPTGAVLDVDYKMISIDMEYYSPTEEGYSVIESKSFGTRRGLHIAKRFAIDCITNHLRTFNPDSQDGSRDCDYEECKYTCSSAVLSDSGPRSEDHSMYLNSDGQFDEDKVYWSNYEILYSDKLIKECREKIIKLFMNKSEVKISEIFDKFLPEYKREYFIRMAINSLAIGRYKVYDAFGFNCYISKGKTSLFLTRDFPERINIENENHASRYTQKLIGITSAPDYRNISNVDDDIINEIENIYVKPDANDEEVELIASQIVAKISKFKTYKHSALIERCFGRIAYTRLVQPEFRNPEYTEKPIDQIVCGDIFPIRCFSHQRSDGSYIFFHNQPDVLQLRKQGEIAKIRSASDPFRLFYIQEGRPCWRNVNSKEQEELSEYAVPSIQSFITKSVTMNINGYPFVSKYYVSYYNGCFRFVNEEEGHGEIFSSVNANKVANFISWVQQTPLMTIPGNYQMLQKINSLIDFGKKEAKAKKIERTREIIKFFIANRLIVTYSVMPKQDDISYDIDVDTEI